MKFSEIKKDYLDLINKHGYPYDLGGGFVQDEQLDIIIRNPTKKNAAKYMENVIRYSFEWGKFYKSELNGNIELNECKIVDRCYKKYVSFEI